MSHVTHERDKAPRLEGETTRRRAGDSHALSVTVTLVHIFICLIIGPTCASRPTADLAISAEPVSVVRQGIMFKKRAASGIGVHACLSSEGNVIFTALLPAPWEAGAIWRIAAVATTGAAADRLPPVILSGHDAC